MPSSRRWSQEPGEGSFPSVETRYTPDELPGLGAEVTYVHTQGTVGLDWRTSPGYTRRGGFIGATLHDYRDQDKNFGFQMVEYEAIQHLPILRETWVLSFRGRVQTAHEKDGQQTPFFMLPALGGGSSLRGYSSWRFRDQNSLLLQAEWRIMVNRYFDMAFFYDAGKVTARTSDIDFDGLKDDYGFGIRFHGPFATPLRVEVARSRESSLQLHLRGVCCLLGSRIPWTCQSFRHVHVEPGSWCCRPARLACLPRAPRRRVLASIRTIRSRASPNRRTPSKAAPYEQSQMYELVYNLFVTSGYKPTGLRAKNINTIDEVPDSSWFTNRIGARAITTEELVRGPNVGQPPDPSKWVLIREKTSGAHPGFTATDAKGETWFLEFDPPHAPEGATAAVAVASKIFWALGYNQVESFLTTFDPKNTTIDPKATIRRPNGKRSSFDQDDMNVILERVKRNPDGTYRVIAGRLLPGKILGGFQYAGTRPDDPNDVVPHEHRRELRALRVFGAWTNLTDIKAKNTHRHGRHRERQDDRQALSAGRRLDVRHVQRRSRVGSELRILLRRWPLAEAPLHPRIRPEPVADRRLRRAPVDRQVRRQGVRSANLAAADADHRLHGAARRRRLLGGAADRGLHRRPDQGGRPDRSSSAIRRPKSISPTC